MPRTMTVEFLVLSGNYKTNSEVLGESLRLLCEKQAISKLETLRQLINDGEKSSTNRMESR